MCDWFGRKLIFYDKLFAVYLFMDERRALRKLNWKLPAKKNEYNYENNILSIYLETLQKLHMNQSQELLVNN